MRIRRDGSIQSSNAPTPRNTLQPADFGIYRCMVTKVKYVDDPANITSGAQNPRVLYDVVVLGGFASGQVVSNCRLQTDLGGNYNYHERILRASSKKVGQTRLSQCDGDIVLVQFLQGDPKFPVITCLDQGINTGISTGATSSDGPIERRQFNGVYSEVDKLGNFTWVRKGGELDQTLGAFVPEDSENVKVEVSDDKVQVTTKGGASYKAEGGKIALGTQAVELLQQISDQLQVLIDAFISESNHTHIGNLGFPTAPPSNLADMTQAASDLSDIKSLIEEIKGTL